MFLRFALFCGLGAATSTLAALTLLSRREGLSPAQPINATSHIFAGEEAGRLTEPDLAHTGTGLLINVGASFFWASIAAAMLSGRAPPSPGKSIAAGAATAALAGLVDYGLVPKRLTPGWELALRPQHVAATMAAMGLGIAAGAMLASRHEPDHEHYR